MGEIAVSGAAGAETRRASTAKNLPEPAYVARLISAWATMKTAAASVV